MLASQKMPFLRRYQLKVLTVKTKHRDIPSEEVCMLFTVLKDGKLPIHSSAKVLLIARNFYFGKKT